MRPVVFWGAVVLAACHPPPEVGPPVEGADAATDGAVDGGAVPDYTVVVLPDTQYYASSWPEIFDAQTRWIAEHRQEIAFVLHTGDVVDSDVPAEWDRASASLRRLDGVVPYVMTAGNHDYFNLADRMGLINGYFPPSHFQQLAWFGDTFEPGHIENNFSVFPTGGGRWLVIALEFGPRDEALAWANHVLAAFHDTPAIVITHAYLFRDGSRYDITASPHQQFNPHDYVMMGQPGTTINDGEEIWRKLIVPNRNVKLVFSGHDVGGLPAPPGTTSSLTSARPDGSMVHQVLANYQTCTAPPCETFDGVSVHGGNGYLRLLRFSPAAATISIETYSPYLDRFLDDPSNKFVLPMN